MMQCTQIQKLLDEYLDGTLGPLQQTAFEQHLGDCNVCRQHVLFAQQLQRRLLDLPDPEVSTDFAARMLESAVSTPRQRQSRQYGFAAGFATAIAAGLALWLVFASPLQINDSATGNTLNIELVTGQTQQISLVFNSPADINNATLRLELPGNVELAGYHAQRHLEWQTPLRKGSNRLMLPMIARGEIDQPLLASITSKGKTRTFTVRLRARGPSATVSPDRYQVFS